MTIVTPPRKFRNDVLEEAATKAALYSVRAAEAIRSMMGVYDPVKDRVFPASVIPEAAIDIATLVDKIDLQETCGACPEQYDAYIGELQVGYLRLRHGAFRVDVPQCGGEVVYQAYPDGDGCFTDSERDHFLGEAMRAIANWLLYSDEGKAYVTSTQATPSTDAHDAQAERRP